MLTKETLLHVEGMTCSSCVRHVESALRRIDGIGTIEVRLREGRVRVRHDPAEVPTAELIEALGNAGYESRTIDP